jgi:hypothetical protein
MPNSAPTEIDEGRETHTLENGVSESISRILDECRTGIDEFLVQLDLGKLDVREEVDHQLATAQNAYLAARSQLSDTRIDASASLRVLRLGLEQVIHDLGRAYQDVDDAVERGRG